MVLCTCHRGLFQTDVATVPAETVPAKEVRTALLVTASLLLSKSQTAQGLACLGSTESCV